MIHFFSSFIMNKYDSQLFRYFCLLKECRIQSRLYTLRKLFQMHLIHYYLNDLINISLLYVFCVICSVSRVLSSYCCLHWVWCEPLWGYSDTCTSTSTSTCNCTCIALIRGEYKCTSALITSDTLVATCYITICIYARCRFNLLRSRRLATHYGNTLIVSGCPEANNNNNNNTHSDVVCCLKCWTTTMIT